MTRHRGKSFPREGQAVVPPRGLTIFWCIYSRSSFDFFPKRLIFPQILRSTQLDMPCLQQSRKKKTRHDCLFFEKILQGVCADVFTRPTLLGFHANGRRRSQNNRNVGTCCAKSLTGFKLYATSANIVVVPCKRTQQVTTLLGATLLRPFAWGLRLQNLGVKCTLDPRAHVSPRQQVMRRREDLWGRECVKCFFKKGTFTALHMRELG